MQPVRLDLNALAVFACVVDEKGFSAASRKLGLSKSAVSKHVSHLEDQTGTRLLQRTTRRLSLTDVGAALYERCARIVAEAEQAERAISQLQTTPKGTLRVSGPLAFGIRHLGRPVADFMNRYPELSVDLQLSDRLVDLVDDGFDVAVRISRLADSSLIARKLCPMETYGVATRAYLDRHGVPALPRDLVGHNCLQYSYATTGDTWVFTDGDGELPVHVRGSLRTNNGDVMLQSVLADVGIALLPAFIAGCDLRDGRLIEVLPAFRPRSTGVYAVYPHSRHLSTKVWLFVDFLAETFAQPSWAHAPVKVA